MIRRLKQWAQRLKAEVVALWFAYRHPQTPWYAKWLAVAVVAYAFSPIDLIPDFIPVLGFLDDALLLPIGIWLTIQCIPRSVLDECRGQAAQWLAEQHAKPRNWTAAAVIIILWVLAAWLIWEYAGRWFFAR
jgi:uncharacterized membrane protein YkvA (DUF1232 family)